MNPELESTDPSRSGAESSRNLDPGPALRAALTSGSRRIHLDLSARGVRLSSRIGGRLREIAFLPNGSGSAMARLLEGAAPDGLGVLSLDGGAVTVRYRLASCPKPDGKALVLTLLPSADEAPAEAIDGLGAPEAIRKALASDMDRGRGLVLVAGPPESGRCRTLAALLGEAELEEERVLLVAFSGAAPPLEGLHHPVLELDLRDELWALLDRVEDMDADRFVLPEIETPLHATLGLALSGSRRLGLAAIRSQDAAGALVKLRELVADRFRAARDLRSVLAQHRFPRPCRHCSSAKPLAPEQVPGAQWDASSRRELLARAPRVRSRGAGCARCAGSGYVGWTYIYEHLSVTEEVEERLRFTSDPGRLREELKALTAGHGLLDAAWVELLRGNIEPEDFLRVPGPEVTPFRANPPSHGQTAAAGEVGEKRRQMPKSVPLATDDESNAPESDATSDHGLYGRGYEVLRRLLSGFLSAAPVEPGPLEEIAGEIAEAVAEDEGLVQTALTLGAGDNLLVHQMNVAVLAARIGLGLGWDEERLERLVIGALLHDAGLLRVPLQVIQKEGKLSGKEARLRRRHSEWGEEMVRTSLHGLEWLPVVVRQVHERETGTGYPDGVAGDRIDPLAKVIRLADALESLTHPRRGRPALAPYDAIQHLGKRTREFDRRVFRAMLSQISLFPVGGWVRLNNGSLARVVSINPDNFYRPVVEIARDAHGREVRTGRPVDLSDSPFLYITGPAHQAAPQAARRAE